MKTVNEPLQAAKLPEKERAAVQVDALYTSLVEGKLDGACAEAEYRDLVGLLQDRVKVRELAVSMVNTSRPQRSLYVVHLAHHLDRNLKASLYENVAHALAMARKWSLVAQAAELGQKYMGHTTIRLLNWRLRSLMELGHFAEVENVATEFSRSSLAFNRLSFHLLISTHLRNRNLLRAKQYLVKMEHVGIPADASTHTLIASVYRSLGLDGDVQAQALASLQDLNGRSGTVVLNSLIRLSLDKGDLDGAIEYISFLEDSSRGLARHLIDGVDSIHHGDEAQASPGRIPVRLAHPISPDVATFTMLVEHLGRAHQLSRVSQVINRMKNAGVQADEVFAEALVRAHVLGGDSTRAVGLVYSLCSHAQGVQSLFAQLGLDSLDNGSIDILPRGLRPTGSIFNALLTGVLEIHGLVGIGVVSQIMDASGIDPDEAFVETVLSYMTKTIGTRPWQLILALKKLTKVVPVTLRHSLVVLSAIVRQESVLVRKGSWYATWKTLQYRKYSGHVAAIPSCVPSDRLSSTSESFDPFAGIVPPQRPSYVTLFRPVIESLLSRGVRSDKAAIALRIRHDAVVKRDVAMAQETFQQMLDRGIHPNRFHYTALMEGYALSGNMSSARNIMSSATKAGHPPDIVMYTILLVGYAYQGRPTLVARIFQNMVSAGIVPDGKAIGVLANAYAAVGEYKTAKRVLLELWHYVGPLPDEAWGAGYKDLLKAFDSAAAARPHSLSNEMSSKQRRATRWRVCMQLWRIIIPRLQRMNPHVSWSKRSQISTQKQQRKMTRRRLSKEGNVLDRASQYTKSTVC